MTLTPPSNAPAAVLRAWVAAVNCGNVDQLVGLYAEDAVLLSTFSAPVLSSPEAIRDYFERLAARPGLSVTLHDRTLRSRPVSETAHVLSGIYCFRFEVDGEPLSFEARFTFVVDVTLPRPIVHHQSAQIPRDLN